MNSTLVRLGIEIMARIPVPGEYYRRILERDSEQRYRSGRWSYMRGAAESHRYSVIVGCCEFFKPGGGAVLDLGCGEGILETRLRYSSYVGVDSNEAAIRFGQRGLERNNKADARFFHADAGEFPVPGQFDIIVFNESLYYIRSPMDVIARYRGSLAPGGILVISMFRTYLARKIWKELARTDLRQLTSATLSNELGFVSDVRVYAAPEAAP